MNVFKRRRFALALGVCLIVFTGCTSKSPERTAQLSIVNLATPQQSLELQAGRDQSGQAEQQWTLPPQEMVSADSLPAGAWTFHAQQQTHTPAEQFRYGLGKDETYLLLLHGYTTDAPLLAEGKHPGLWQPTWLERARSVLGGMEAQTTQRYLLQAKLLRVPQAKPDDLPRVRLVACAPSQTQLVLEVADADGDQHTKRALSFPQVSDWIKLPRGTSHVTVRQANSPAVIASGKLETPGGSVTTVLVAPADDQNSTTMTAWVHQLVEGKQSMQRLAISSKE